MVDLFGGSAEIVDADALLVKLLKNGVNVRILNMLRNESSITPENVLKSKFIQILLPSLLFFLFYERKHRFLPTSEPNGHERRIAQSERRWEKCANRQKQT